VNELKPRCEQAHATEISTAGIAVISMLHGYSFQTTLYDTSSVGVHTVP